MYLRIKRETFGGWVCHVQSNNGPGNAIFSRSSSDSASDLTESIEWLFLRYSSKKEEKKERGGGVAR